MTLFALGFRPLYLLAGLYAALSVPLWAAQYAGWLPGANLYWHAHEMLFGYAFAVIAGFLLTAVRVWTGRPTPSGAPLAAIAGLWLAARIVAFNSLFLSSLIDAAFAVAVAWGIGQPILATRNRNAFFVGLVLALGAASVAFQAWPQVALAVGLDVVLLVIAIMGGRVIPPFTNNGAPGANARRNAWLERAALGSVILILLLDVVQIPAWPVALLAAALHAARLALWSPLATRGRPILWILHVSYVWIPIGLALLAAAQMGWIPASGGIHALAVGATGGLIIGMVTRTARGHTGRPLKVSHVETCAYLLVLASALVRVAVPIAWPSLYLAALLTAGGLWVAAFAIYLVKYTPWLMSTRLDGKDG